MTTSDKKERNSFTVRRQWAIFAARGFRYRFPEARVQLYESPVEFLLVLENCPERFEDMASTFDGEIRPVTCPMRVIQHANPSLLLVDERQDYVQELWLSGEPISTPAANQLLMLTRPDIPLGGIDYSHVDDAWVFTSHNALTEDEKNSVRAGLIQIGMVGGVLFNVSSPDAARDHQRVQRTPESLALSSSRSKNLPDSVRRLVSLDEDMWRDFLSTRTLPEVDKPRIAPKQFSCLFDTTDRSDISLSELLTIYDRVDLIPERDNPNWLEKHKLTVQDFLQLAASGQCRLVLPYSPEYCRPDLLDGLAQLDPSTLVLSRSLAARTIEAGQAKDPLLYGPFSAQQRSDILRLLYETAPNDRFKDILNCYGEMFRRQHYCFMMNGALASLSCGVGAYLGEVMERLRGADARIELATAGANVEWAMALGSTCIPRSFGEGYDETSNSHLVASFLGRTKYSAVDPISTRMHALADGLLAVNGIPPLEVARNFHGTSVVRFRSLARRLMIDAPTHAEMDEAIQQINDDIIKFERRTTRLARWKLDTLFVGAVGMPIGNAIDAQVGPYASLISGWLYELLKRHIPSTVKSELSGVKDTMLGLALSPSADAVVVSRSRKNLKDPR